MRPDAPSIPADLLEHSQAAALVEAAGGTAKLHDGGELTGPLHSRPLDILVLEDDDSTRRLLQVALTTLGHQVIGSATLGDAVKLLKTFVFDLLLVDLILPDGSGLEILQHIPKGIGVRAIVLSGLGQEEHVRRTLDAGFDDHLVKPIDLTLLQRAVWKATGRTL